MSVPRNFSYKTASNCLPCTYTCTLFSLLVPIFGPCTHFIMLECRYLSKIVRILIIWDIMEWSMVLPECHTDHLPIRYLTSVHYWNFSLSKRCVFQQFESAIRNCDPNSHLSRKFKLGNSLGWNLWSSHARLSNVQLLHDIIFMKHLWHSGKVMLFDQQNSISTNLQDSMNPSSPTHLKNMTNIHRRRQPFNGYYTCQPTLAGTSSWKWRILWEEVLLSAYPCRR